MSDGERLDLQQPRSLSQILICTARLYARFPLLFAILAVAVMGPYDLIVLAGAGYGPLNHSHESIVASLLLLLLRVALITPLISALHMHAVATIGEGRRPRLKAVALQGLGVLPVVAAAEIMSAIGVAIGFLALLVPGVMLSLRWAVVAQVAALEGKGWLPALRRSARLTTEHYGAVFALLATTGVFGFAVREGAIAIPLGSSTGPASVLVGIAVDTLIASYSALTLALLYFHLRALEPEAESAR
jgi:hypothetical protein